MTCGIDVACILESPLASNSMFARSRYFDYSGIVFLLSLFKNDSHFVPGDAPVLATFSHLDRYCSPGCDLGRPVDHFGILLVPFSRFGYLSGSISVLEIILFGTQICKESVEQPKKLSSNELHLARATCGTLLQALD